VALDANALVEVDEARTYLGIEKGDDPEDAWFEQVISGLSLRVLQHTGRVYINSDGDDKASTRSYVGYATDTSIAIDDCREISKVEFTGTPDDADSWEEADAGSWVAEPLNGPTVNVVRFFNPDGLPAQGHGWGALALHLSGRSEWGQATPWPGQARAEISARVFLRVTAKWGYGKDNTTVPANVKLAVLMWLQNIHKRDAAFFKDTAKALAQIEIPADVKSILEGEAASEATVVAV
jgi:hypothetical protein